MQTVSELRIKHIDYSDNTPNEPRYTDDNILDDIVYYPLGSIYPNIYKNIINKLPFLITGEDKHFEEEYFLNNLNKQRIEYAIKYLQINALKKYITKNFKNVLFLNPFTHLFDTKYPIDKNIEATREIIKILIDNYDNYYELITNIYDMCYKKDKLYIKDLLYEYLPIDPINQCMICLQTEPYQQLFNPCKCTQPIHTDCLLKIIEMKKDNCSICLYKYKINQPITTTSSGINIKPEVNERIYFPFQDIYYEPLLSNSILHKYTGMSRLTMAIIFLQVDRVNELLQEREILDGLPDYYFGYEKLKQTPLMALAIGNLPSNAHISFKNNLSKYILIIDLLLDTKKIDLEKKDDFNKTFMDYIKENKYLIKRYYSNFLSNIPQTSS